MSRGKKSIYTAVSAIFLTLLNGLLGLIVTRLVILHYGSDFNGLNSTANQFVNMLLIVEGGFTLATNVALFRPLSEHDYGSINRIMAATKKIFLIIGFSFLGLGIVASIGYAMVIKSKLSGEIVVLTFIMAIVSTSFNLLYATKYRILLQTEQREYILNFIRIVTIIFSQSLIIAIVFLEKHMLLVRFTTMVGAIINSLLIGFACKKLYKYLDFRAEPNYLAIKGTKDVFAQKLTSMVYNTLPIIFISATVGTMYASVYAVYNSVFSLLKSVLYSLINAPRMGLGHLIVEKDKNYVYKVFLQYEFVVINTMLCFLTTATVLIMPFINLYTAGIKDVEYKNWYIALFLIAITFFELIHIPSGNILNMSGNFKLSKKFQILACIVMILVMIIGNLIYGFYGILAAVLIAAILLALLEITYIHKAYFKESIFDLLKLLLPNVAFAAVLIYIEFGIMPVVEGYLQFIVVGVILVAINLGVIVVFNIVVNKTITTDVLERVRQNLIK
jgi:O-antigen/teichoic acid export membrane protein